MTIHVEISEPLARQVEDAAKSCATSPEAFVIDAVSKMLAERAALLPVGTNGSHGDSVLGLFADDAELIDSIVEDAMNRRQTAPMRSPRE